jgi:hypothetical protein
MRIKSPVGEYDYRVTALRLGRSGLEVDGSLGQWQTTTLVTPGELVRVVAPVAALGAIAYLAGRRR